MTTPAFANELHILQVDNAPAESLAVPEKFSGMGNF